MALLKRLNISILFGFLFLTVISGQNGINNDSIKYPYKVIKKDPNQFQFKNNHAKSNQPALKNMGLIELPSMDIQQLEPLNMEKKQLDQSSLIQIGGHSNELLYGSEMVLDFSFLYSDNLSFNTSFLVGRLATPFDPEGVNYYNLNLDSEFYINPYLTGSAGMFYKSTLEHPSSIMGGYFGTVFNPFYKLSLSNTLSYHNHRSNDSQFNQQSIMLDTHARYKLSEKYYFNFYGGAPLNERSNNNNIVLPSMPKKYVGGTVEFWINPKVGIESGVMWKQDMFNNKMILTPLIIGITIDKRRK